MHSDRIDTMKVYVVEGLSSFGNEVLAVFSTRKLAEEFAIIENVNERITEFIIDSEV